MDAPLLDAVIRLVRVLDEPALIRRIAPLVQQEIMVRLLSGIVAQRFGAGVPLGEARPA
jgi:hypothetical protein